VLFSVKWYSTFAKPFNENNDWGITRFNCELIKLSAAIHCAAVAVQFEGSTAVPAEFPINGFVIRLMPSDFPSIHSKFENQKSWLPSTDPPAFAPACCRDPLG